jgi:hypothetical protein
MTTYIIPPTVLYIKQHSVTGLKYFGKTTQDPLKYNGSGVYWTDHIKKHGKEHVTTVWISEPYIDSDTIAEFALAFSLENNIVESSTWANLKPENGLDGGVAGPNGKKGIPTGPKSTEHKQKISVTLTGKLSGKKGNPSGPQQNPHGPRGPTGPQLNPSGPRGPQKNPAPEVECPHCGLVGRGGNMKRYHFDNCKKKPTIPVSF